MKCTNAIIFLSVLSNVSLGHAQQTQQLRGGRGGQKEADHQAELGIVHPTATPVDEQGAIVAFTIDFYRHLNGEYFPSTTDIIGGRAVWDQIGDDDDDDGDDDGNSNKKMVFYCTKKDIWVFTNNYWREMLITENGGECEGYEFSLPGWYVMSEEKPYEFWEYIWRGQNEISAPSSSSSSLVMTP